MAEKWTSGVIESSLLLWQVSQHIISFWNVSNSVLNVGDALYFHLFFCGRCCSRNLCSFLAHVWLHLLQLAICHPRECPKQTSCDQHFSTGVKMLSFDANGLLSPASSVSATLISILGSFWRWAVPLIATYSLRSQQWAFPKMYLIYRNNSENHLSLPPAYRWLMLSAMVNIGSSMNPVFLFYLEQLQKDQFSPLTLKLVSISSAVWWVCCSTPQSWNNTNNWRSSSWLKMLQKLTDHTAFR